MQITTRRLKRLAVGLLLLALAGEIGVRLYERFLVDGEVAVLHLSVDFHDDYWTLRPDRVVVQPERFGDVRYSSNALGFRDRDHDPDAETRRIVFLGDSVTFGLTADQDVLFTDRVAEILNQESAGGAPFESINLALFAYAPVNELAVLKRYGLPARPEVLVLQIYMNDFWAASLKPQGSRTRSMRGLSDRLRTIRNIAVNHSALFRRLRQAQAALIHWAVHDLRRTHFTETLGSFEPDLMVARFRDHPEDDYFPSFGQVEELARIAERFGIGFVLVLTPHELQLYSDAYDSINERIRRSFEARGIPLHDPLAQMRAAPDKTRLFHDGVHLSARGHQWFADYLAPLVREQLAPGSGTRSRSEERVDERSGSGGAEHDQAAHGEQGQEDRRHPPLPGVSQEGPELPDDPAAALGRLRLLLELAQSHFASSSLRHAAPSRATPAGAPNRILTRNPQRWSSPASWRRACSFERDERGWPVQTFAGQGA